MKHLDPKFQCSVCEKKFGSKQNLEQHEVTHSGLTFKHCGFCDMSFKRLHHYKSHLNSLGHKAKAKDELVEVDNFNRTAPRCDICMLTFKFDYHLRQHLKSKEHLSKADEIVEKQVNNSDFSLVIPQFNDEDLINLSDNSFLDDSNVQYIIVNEANQDVMLMTSDEVKLSDAATEEHNLMI